MLALLAILGGCTSRVTQAAEAPLSVQRAEYFAVNGARLFVLMRGADRRTPILLWLHGGPGGPERPLFRYYNGDLENHFVVAYWDQRSAGRSFDPEADPRTLSVSRHLADLDAVVDYLRRVFGQDKIVLIGHSWGAALGLLYVQRHPDKVSALIAVAPLISLRKAQQAEYEFVSAEAGKRKDATVLARLREIGPPPHETADRQLAMEDLADRYGAVFHNRPCKICVVLQGLLTSLVTPGEMMSIHRGIHASLDAMTPDLLRLDLERDVPSVDVPVFFFLGRHDRHIDSTIAAGYLEKLRAPRKQLVWFEGSAHNVPFEEPRLFNVTVLEVLQSIAIPARTTFTSVAITVLCPNGVLYSHGFSRCRGRTLAGGR